VYIDNNKETGMTYKFEKMKGRVIRMIEDLEIMNSVEFNHRKKKQMSALLKRQKKAVEKMDVRHVNMLVEYYPEVFPSLVGRKMSLRMDDNAEWVVGV
jgi:TATA-box binding protein (TBP) (component of TFIID and TFIIIB)